MCRGSRGATRGFFVARRLNRSGVTRVASGCQTHDGGSDRGFSGPGDGAATMEIITDGPTLLLGGTSTCAARGRSRTAIYELLEGHDEGRRRRPHRDVDTIDPDRPEGARGGHPPRDPAGDTTSRCAAAAPPLRRMLHLSRGSAVSWRWSAAASA